MPDLWNEQREARRRTAEPLAARLRPRSLDEIVGQTHILGEGKLLRRMLDADRLTSIILHGPPGTGKTTLAEVIAAHTRSHFERANAAMAGVARIREILDAAARRLEEDGRRTILFLDEIHRFARNQQDVLLNDVERGVVVLVGATTENPYFAVNSALVSRSTVFRLEPLSEAEIAEVLRRAVIDPRAFPEIVDAEGRPRPIEIDDEALAHWARTSDGDARRALAALEVAVLSAVATRASSARSRAGATDAMESPPSPAGASRRGAPPQRAAATGGPPRVAGTAATEAIRITLDIAADSIQRKALVHDPTGDGHYDLASALIKSMRGGDPDAAVYWLARMLEAGEDPRFIARRIAILASEDIGLADPRALEVAAAAWTVTERVGMPECQLTLSEAVLYMCMAPKSNAAARAIWSAMDDVREGRTVPVPMRLRDQNNRRFLERETSDGSREGSVERYRSPHDVPSEAAEAGADYLGVDRTYYVPTVHGEEAKLAEAMRAQRALYG